VFLAFIILGGVLLLLSLVTLFRNLGVDITGMSRLSRYLWHFRWILGAALGVASFFFSYRMESPTTDDVYQVHGWPFFAYAFDQRGWDYVGPLTLPFIFLNLVVWALLPQLLVWPLSWSCRRRGKDTPFEQRGEDRARGRPEPRDEP